MKEPNGVDFIIQGEPLTVAQKQTISDFIKADKERTAPLKKPDSKSVNRQHTRTKNKA